MGGRCPASNDSEIMHEIMLSPKLFRERGLDTLVWAASASGLFMTKSAYKQLRHQGERNLDEDVFRKC